MSEWRDIDFRPASGWRAAYIYPDGSHGLCPVAGWLIQEQGEANEWAEWAEDQKPAADRERRVVAAIAGADYPGCVEAVDAYEDIMDFPSFWYLLAPGEEPPTADAIKEEYARRRRAQEEKKARALKRAADAAPKVLAWLVQNGPAGLERVASALFIKNRRTVADACWLLEEQGRLTHDDHLQFNAVLAAGSAS